MLLLMLMSSIFTILIGFYFISIKQHNIGFLLAGVGVIAFHFVFYEIPVYECLDGNLYNDRVFYLEAENKKWEIINKEEYIFNSTGKLLKANDLKRIFLKF